VGWGSDAETVTGKASGILRTRQWPSLIRGLLAGAVISVNVAQAQFTANFQVNLISGVTSNWSGNYVVGSNTFSDVLVIQSGGVLSNGIGYIGYTAAGSNNTAAVTGAGSTWICQTTPGWTGIYVGYGSAGNSLLIENGGAVSSTNGFVAIGSSGPGSNNTLLVTGSNSVLVAGAIQISGQGSQMMVTNNAHLSNTGSPTVGAGSKLTISGGGQLVDIDAVVSGTVIVTGPGSIWNNTSYGVYMGGASAGITVSNGGQVVIADGLIVDATATNLFAVAQGGMLTVTGGTTSVQNGILAISGTATIDSLQLTNAGGSVSFPKGVLNAGSIQANNGIVFAIGDGTNAATLNLEGGIYTFSTGCRVSSNSFLTGCGTISGNVTVDPGATVLANCGGTLTFAGGTVTNNGLLRATNGTVLESYGTVVNNGVIDILTGTTNFHGAFINNGAVVDASSFNVVAIAPLSNGVNIAWTTVGGRSNVVQIATGSGGYSGIFTDASPVITLPGTSLGTGSFTDAGAFTNTSSRFYRVRLVP